MPNQQDPNTSSNPNGFWPTIDSPAMARKVARQGVWAAILVAVITTIMIFVMQAMGPIEDVPLLDAWAFIDVGLFVAIALGIHKMSRVAAVSGFALYLLGRIYAWSQVGASGNVIFSLLFLLAFLNAIRATFAYHRFRRQSIEADLADIEADLTQSKSEPEDLNVR